MTPEIATENSLFTNKFSAYILGTLLANGHMTKNALVSGMPGSMKTLYGVIKELQDKGYICNAENDRTIGLTVLGTHIAELLSELDQVETGRSEVGIEGSEIEDAVKGTFAKILNREFPSNLSLAPFINAIMRDAYPGVKFVPCVRKPYVSSSLSVEKPYVGKLRYDGSASNKTESPSADSENTEAGESSKISREVWVEAKKAQIEKEKDREQRILELRRILETTDEALVELAMSRGSEWDLGVKFRRIMTERMKYQEELKTLSE